MTLKEKLLWLRWVTKWQHPPYNRKLWRKVKRLKREVRGELDGGPPPTKSQQWLAAWRKRKYGPVRIDNLGVAFQQYAAGLQAGLDKPSNIRNFAADEDEYEEILKMNRLLP